MYATSLNVCGQTFKDAYDGFKQQAQNNYKDFRQKANKVKAVLPTSLRTGFAQDTPLSFLVLGR